MTRAVFLDRDGTLNRDVDFVRRVEDLEVLPGVVEALQRLHTAGYRLIVTMPEGASIERRKMLRLMDAQLELTPSKLGMAGAIARANEILASTPDAWMPRQFDNPANPDMHAATTAEEIWTDT